MVAGRPGLGPAHHEAPVGLVGQRRPDLLAGDHPLVPVEYRLGLHVGQVAPGVGLRVALAPQLGAGHDGREEPGLLRGGPVLDEGGAEQALPEDADPARGLGPHVLLVEDDLVGDGGPPAAVLGRPAETGPAAGGQHLLPLRAGSRTRRSRRPTRPGRRGRRTRRPHGRPARRGPPCGRPRPRVGLEGPWLGVSWSSMRPVRPGTAGAGRPGAGAGPAGSDATLANGIPARSGQVYPGRSRTLGTAEPADGVSTRVTGSRTASGRAVDGQPAADGGPRGGKR